ncbi:MAG TPA: hypothetical protein VGN44_08640 [Candidatus Angelobacter sp.]|jgi:outer membrane biosynthesis protein TonB
MKLLRPQYALFLLVLILGISGCSEKKPVLVAPQQPPPTAPQPTPTPEPEATSQPAEQPAGTQPPATSTTPTTAATTKPKIVKRPVVKKKPTKTVIVPDKDDKKDAPTSASGGQISPRLTADAAHSQASTEQLLQDAEDNLNSIKRQLSKDEEAMRAQIREFINQSKKATTENDLARAHTLAVKARLLSDELLKQR